MVPTTRMLVLTRSGFLLHIPQIGLGKILSCLSRQPKLCSNISIELALPSFCRLPSSLYIYRVGGERVLLLHLLTVGTMVHYGVKQYVSIAFSINSCKQVFSNCVICETCFISNRILYLIHPCVNDWIVVGSPDRTDFCVFQLLCHSGKCGSYVPAIKG